MTSKKKTVPTSSETNSTTSSNSSSSSSSSSSTSGSDSSSSDTENSTTSQGSISKSLRGNSTDSETLKPAKKKGGTSKNKSLESEGTKSKDGKGKASATKGRASKANAANDSSESEEPASKSNTKRVLVRRSLALAAKPKPTASATILPKQTKQKSVSAQKSAVVKAVTNARKANADKEAKSSKETASQKDKKLKSIFSPENSSESDDQTPPPKLTPMKIATATTKSIARQKAKQKPCSKANAIAISSGSSRANSVSSYESGDSVFDSSMPWKSKQTPVLKKKVIPALEKEVLTENDESKKRPTTRKQTRLSSARRSKHLVGKQSDTESEPEAVKQVVKRAPRVNKSPRKVKGRANKQEPPVEERRCPLEGCDSTGHLGGRFEKHFTIEACPMYHNKTAQECKDAFAERKKRDEERRKTTSFGQGKTNLPTQEQKAYSTKVKEMRTVVKTVTTDMDQDSAESCSTIEEKQREPKLKGVASEYDLKLFQEAQAVASEKMEEDLKTLPHVKGTRYIEMGKFEMVVWYQSPYPEEYARVPKLYLCEYCLRYMKSSTILKRHSVKCVWRHPPGEEVYRKEKISVWEVDGKRYKQYCQNLCLLAKFFLDHKTLYYDVEPFLFYVMTIGDAEGCHTVGYFSKEKNSFLNYNVSCILTLPPYQRQGYGRLLIDFSYLLTRTEGKIGSPEKPLSDLGLISYRSYWKDVLLEYLCNFGGKELSIKDISQEMAINSYDIVSTLQALGMMKYWKGKHIILKKQDVIEEYVERMKRRGSAHKEIDAAFLKWKPFVAPPTSGTT